MESSCLRVEKVNVPYKPTFDISHRTTHPSNQPSYYLAQKFSFYNLRYVGLVFHLHYFVSCIIPNNNYYYFTKRDVRMTEALT